MKTIAASTTTPISAACTMRAGTRRDKKQESQVCGGRKRAREGRCRSTHRRSRCFGRNLRSI
eukprot:3374199-Rhodomonas_salina.1